MMKISGNFLLFIIFIAGAFSCKQQYQPDEIVIEEEEAKPKGQSKPIELPNDLFYYKLTTSRSAIDLRPYTYFGGFFADRLMFYHLKYPGINFRGADVKEIYLYFIDDSLVKVRYEFKEDILTKITDYMQSGNPDLNETLRISWNFPDRRVMYSRMPVGQEHNYFLYEEVHGYKKLVREAERSNYEIVVRGNREDSAP